MGLNQGMHRDRRGPPRLGRDNVVRFLDAQHFLEKLADYEGCRRALVQSDRRLESHARIRVGFEVSGVRDQVIVDAVVMASGKGHLWLELPDIDIDLPKLKALGLSLEETYAHAGIAHGDEITEEVEVPAALSELDDPSETLVDAPSALPAGKADPAPSTTMEPSTSEMTPTRRIPDIPNLPTLPSIPARLALPALLALPPPRADTLVEQARLPADDPETTPDAPADQLTSSDSTSPDASKATDAETVEPLEHPGVPRATREGVVTLDGPDMLLGLWLLGLRHRSITVWGGPQEPPGAEVMLTLDLGRKLVLPARVVARFGPWLTLSVADSGPLRVFMLDVLSDQHIAVLAPSDED